MNEYFFLINSNYKNDLFSWHFGTKSFYKTCLSSYWVGRFSMKCVLDCEQTNQSLSIGSIMSCIAANDIKVLLFRVLVIIFPTWNESSFVIFFKFNVDFNYKRPGISHTFLLWSLQSIRTPSRIHPLVLFYIFAKFCTIEWPLAE